MVVKAQRGLSVPISELERVHDELLVVLVQSGDRRAGERLAARWQPRLLRAARRILRSEDRARDAVQDAWASIFPGMTRLNDPAVFPAWAFGILHRRCVDRIRGDVRRARDGADTDQAFTASFGEGDSLDIARAMAGLDHEHRTAAVLHFCEGLTLAEVAAAVGVPVGTAKSRIFHARRRLKAALSGDT
jgi:RNA polymerase sigma factor (sigma-70 family)